MQQQHKHWQPLCSRLIDCLIPACRSPLPAFLLLLLDIDLLKSLSHSHPQPLCHSLIVEMVAQKCAFPSPPIFPPSPPSQRWWHNKARVKVKWSDSLAEGASFLLILLTLAPFYSFCRVNFASSPQTGASKLFFGWLGCFLFFSDSDPISNINLEFFFCHPHISSLNAVHWRSH